MSSTSGKKAWRKKVRLFHEQKGKCHYCPDKMVLSKGPKNGRGAPDSLLATFEHLDDRFSSERGKHSGERRIVLAHYKCNLKRAREREKEVGLEVLWAKSGAYPKNHPLRQRATHESVDEHQMNGA